MAKFGQQPDNDNKENQQHHGIPHWNQRMLIGRTAEQVAEEPHRRAQSSYNQSRPTPGHPCHKQRGQQVECRYYQLAARQIIDEAHSNCQGDSRNCSGKLRSKRKLPNCFHEKPQSEQSFDKALRLFVHAPAGLPEKSRPVQRRAHFTFAPLGMTARDF